MSYNVTYYLKDIIHKNVIYLIVYVDIIIPIGIDNYLSNYKFNILNLHFLVMNISDGIL